MNLKKITSFGFQLIIFITIYLALEYFQTRNMLETNQNIPQNQINLVSVQSNKSTAVALTSQTRPTLVYFFAPWCQVCHLSMPNLVALQQDSNESVNIIAIALDYASQDKVTGFLNEHALNFPVYYGNRAVQQKFKVTSYPSYYLIQPDGTVSHKVTGYTSQIGMKMRL